MSDQVNTPRWQDADQYREDLNPTPGAGVNDGNLGAHPEKADDARTAADVKAAQRSLPGFTDDELKEITIAARGRSPAAGRDVHRFAGFRTGRSSARGPIWWPAGTTGTWRRARSITCSGTG